MIKFDRRISLSNPLKIFLVPGYQLRQTKCLGRILIIMELVYLGKLSKSLCWDNKFLTAGVTKKEI